MLLKILCGELKDSNTYRSKTKKKNALDSKQSFSCTVKKEIEICFV